MSKLRKTLKLHVQGKSKVFISNYLGISRNTVKKYLRVFEQMKLTFEELDEFFRFFNFYLNVNRLCPRDFILQLTNDNEKRVFICYYLSNIMLIITVSYKTELAFKYLGERRTY